MINRVEILASACHAAWYAYAVLGLGEDGEPWETAPEWQKESIRSAVDFWEQCLQMGDQSQSMLERAERLAPKSHINWMEDKARDGWMYGETKDAVKRTHPCMVPYSDLPEEQKKKDIVVLQAFLTVRECLPLGE